MNNGIRRPIGNSIKVSKAVFGGATSAQTIALLLYMKNADDNSVKLVRCFGVLELH